MMRITILGFGLIGASLAMAARRAFSSLQVTAIDLPVALRSEAAERAADLRVDATDAAEVSKALRGSSVTVLAAPVRVIVDRLVATLEQAPIVTDCGSTKRVIVERGRESPRFKRFVPGHPMAGFARGTSENASADLFQDRSWILCAEHSDRDAQSEVEQLVRAVGARPVAMTAAEHDAAVARTSHLPQLLGSALSVVAGAAAAERAAGPAFERATRAAGGPESVWRDIFATNSDEVARALRALCAELELVARGLEADGDASAAMALLARARSLHPRKV